MTNFLSYKRHIAVLDANDTEVESWITVRGNHIPIKKGQSKEEAVKSFIEKKNDKEMSKRSNEPKTLGEATKKVVSQSKENKEIREASKESSKKWNGAWSKRTNKPTTVGEASKNATSISKMTKMSSSERNEEVGFPMLEIAYNDVEFTENPEKNRSALSKAIKESGHENADLMQSVLSGLSEKELKDADSIKKGIRDYMKLFIKKKTTDSWNKLWGKK